MPARILVIDDDELIRLTVSVILEDAGYAVETAENGLAALARLECRTPELVLLDISMPQMDGYAFVEALAKRGLRERLPIVVLTADGRAQQKAQAVGAAGYLAKPFTMDGLIATVSQLLT